MGNAVRKSIGLRRVGVLVGLLILYHILISFGAT
jgi:hypothetical protein